MKRCRVGIVGAGDVVRTYHLPVLLAMPEVELAWLCDKNLGRALSLKNDFRLRGAVHSSLDECADVDAVLIAVPVGLRAPVFAAIWSRRWHMLCEKPFARTRSEHESFYEGSKQAGLVCEVGLMRRFYRSTQSLQRMIREQPLGKVLRVFAGEGGQMRGTGRDSWYLGSRELSGGGVLIETGSHIVDQVCTILGAKRFALESVVLDQTELAEFSAHIKAYVGGTRDTTVPVEIQLSYLEDLACGIEVEFEHGYGRMGLAPDSPVTLINHLGKSIGTFDGGSGELSVYGAFAAEWRHFLARVSASRPEDDDSTSLVATDFIESCYRTAAATDSLGVEMAI